MVVREEGDGVRLDLTAFINATNLLITQPHIISWIRLPYIHYLKIDLQLFLMILAKLSETISVKRIHVYLAI